MLELRDIHLKRRGKYILSSINFSLKKGELLLVRGLNGRGKSSLLHLIIGLIKPNKGEIINSFQSSLLFQESQKQFIAPTVLDDICFTPACQGKELSKKALLMLKNFNLEHLKDSFLDELSEGEKKIVALLGVMITNSELLLLDEPSNHLDHKNKEKLLKLIDDDKRAFIISSHDKLFYKLKRKYKIIRL